MKNIERYLIFLLLGSFIIVFVPAHAQIVTLARKIKSKHTCNKEVASIVLDTDASAAFKAVMDTLRSKPEIKVTQLELTNHEVRFSRGDGSASLKVDSTGRHLSHITVKAEQSGQPSKQKTDAGARTIMSACTKLVIKYTVEKE